MQLGFIVLSNQVAKACDFNNDIIKGIIHVKNIRK